MDYIFRCTKNLVLRYQVSDIFHANELTVYDATLLYIHRYYNIYISDFFSRPRSLLLLPSSLLIFFAHKENTPSFDSISILSTHGPHVSLFLSLSLPLFLFNPSITLDFIPFVFISRRNERSVEHVYLRECILSRYSAGHVYQKHRVRAVRKFRAVISFLKCIPILSNISIDKFFPQIKANFVPKLTILFSQFFFSNTRIFPLSIDDDDDDDDDDNCNAIRTISKIQILTVILFFSFPFFKTRIISSENCNEMSNENSLKISNF